MFELNSDRDLERALRELSPAPTALDRDRLMFRAGQVAGPRVRVFWPAATAVLAFGMVFMAVLLVGSWRFESMAPVRPQATIMPPQAKQQRLTPPAPQAPRLAPPEAEAESTVDEATPPSAGSEEISENARVRLQDQIARWGLDAVPASPPLKGPEVNLPPVKIERGAKSTVSGVQVFWGFFQ